MNPAIILLSPSALDVARRIKAALPNAALHGKIGRVDQADIFFADISEHLRRLFAEGTPIIGICASGILIRALAPSLADKQTEPPVLAVGGDGASVVPLLGGHHGANAMAEQIAKALGGHAALTTASDVTLGFALDEPPPGWRIANPWMAKPLTAALLADEKVRLIVEAGKADWLDNAGLGDAGQLSVRVTDRAGTPGDAEFVLHPPVLVVGIGCERGAAPEEVEALMHRALTESGLTESAVACITSIDLKEDEAAILALAEKIGISARFFSAAQLEAETPRLLNPSEEVFRAVGAHGVAEAACLAAAGPDSTLIVPKIKSPHATCAIARSPRPIDPSLVGKAKGHLHIVGIGPGDAQWRSPQASSAIAAADDLVGYSLYLDLLGDAELGKRRHENQLGAEEDRARLALDLATQGNKVALICSGDAGIYALASLVLELVEREDKPAWNRLDIEVVPGISALQAAAARAGAPLGHDFCAISLSDLLTPWEIVQRRLHAAAEGDFVVALYNPASQRRRTQLVEARDILRAARPPTTPVILARNLGRIGETLVTTTLAQFDPDQVDMLTIVLIGNSETRAIARGTHHFVYTPRGYGQKSAP